MSPSKLREPLLRKQSKKGLLPTLAKPRSRAELKARCGRRHIRRMFGRADGPLPNRDVNSDHPRFSAANMRVLERFPGRLNRGVFSCRREYDSSFVLGGGQHGMPK